MFLMVSMLDNGMESTFIRCGCSNRLHLAHHTDFQDVVSALQLLDFVSTLSRCELSQTVILKIDPKLCN